MKKESFLAAIAALSMSSGIAYAADSAAAMEKCQVIKDGKGMIKEHMADCKTSSHSCAGHNPAGEVEAWISVPAGMCAQINASEVDNVPTEIMAKIET